MMVLQPDWIKRKSALCLFMVGFLTVIVALHGNSWIHGAVQSGSAAVIWVDKGCGSSYNDEEWIDIYFNVFSPALDAVVTITHYPPQRSSTVWIESMRVTTNEDYRISRKADCPEGLHRVGIAAVVTVGGVSETVTSECVYYVRRCKSYDYDHDGYISVLSGGDDCDDFDENVYPGAQEVCDGKDNNCNRLTDEGLDCNYVKIWVDRQCGGYYNDRERVYIYFTVYSAASEATVTLAEYSTQGARVVLLENKLVTTNEVYDVTGTAKCPAGVERLVVTATLVVDGKTKTVTGECSFQVVNCRTPDSDGDGYNSVLAGGDDCNDDDPTVYPGAQEICDGKDNNCNGQKDEGFTDNDQDGYAECGGDCDDANPEIHPEATEVQDSIDNDCDGEIDEKASIDQIDEDQDGYPLSVDCNDRNRSIHPVATELCNDGIDNDCDGKTDCNDTDCEGDSACEKGVTLPFDISFDLSGILSLISENKLYVAAGAAGLVAVIMIVLSIRLMRKGKRRVPPVTEIPSVTGIPSGEPLETSVREPRREPVAEPREVPPVETGAEEIDIFEEIEESEITEEESEESLDIEEDLFGDMV